MESLFEKTAKQAVVEAVEHRWDARHAVERRACAVPAPSSARGVQTAPHGRDALLRVRGNLCTWAELRLQSVNTESAEVPGTREAEIAKAILPIDPRFVS